MKNNVAPLDKIILILSCQLFMRCHLLHAALSHLPTTLIVVVALSKLIILEHLLKFELSCINQFCTQRKVHKACWLIQTCCLLLHPKTLVLVVLSIPQGHQYCSSHWSAKQLYTLCTVYLVSLCLYCPMTSRWIGIQICTSSAGMQQAVSVFTTQTLVQCVNTFNAMIS